MPHIHEKYDFIVSIFVVRGDSVLFANHTRYNKWVPIGGHVELDEDPEETVFREVTEETGMTIKLLGERPQFNAPGVKSLIAPRFMNVHEANAPHKHISLIYFATTQDSDFKKSDEHIALRWLTDIDLDDPYFDLPDSLKLYAREAITAANQK